MPNYVTTTSGIHVPTSANNGTDLALGLKQMGDDIDARLAALTTTAYDLGTTDAGAADVVEAATGTTTVGTTGVNTWVGVGGSPTVEIDVPANTQRLVLVSWACLAAGAPATAPTFNVSTGISFSGATTFSWEPPTSPATPSIHKDVLNVATTGDSKMQSGAAIAWLPENTIITMVHALDAGAMVLSRRRLSISTIMDLPA